MALFWRFLYRSRLKEIVDYAAKRYITVIPEIDLPGHMMAAISAYPYLSCKGEQWSLRTVWGVEDIVMCPGKEDMFRFLDDIFSEIVPLFPGKFPYRWRRVSEDQLEKLPYLSEAYSD